MGKWRNIAIIISIIVGITVGWCYYNYAPKVEDNKNDPVVQEDYDYLKECISKVAETLNTDVIEDPNVKVYSEFSVGAWHIMARLLRNNDIHDVKCTVEAQYNLIIDDGIKVDYDSVTYRMMNNTEDTLLSGQLLSIFIGVICGVIVYFLLYIYPKSVLKNNDNKI